MPSFKYQFCDLPIYRLPNGAVMREAGLVDGEAVIAIGGQSWVVESIAMEGVDRGKGRFDVKRAMIDLDQRHPLFGLIADALHDQKDKDIWDEADGMDLFAPDADRIAEQRAA